MDEEVAELNVVHDPAVFSLDEHTVTPLACCWILVGQLQVGDFPVLYVPQHFFETICNETEITTGGAFDLELKKVVFSSVNQLFIEQFQPIS